VAPLVSAEGLVKRYGPVTAVGGVSFRVEEGECFGLLGPNGAGKSTLLRMVLGISPPSGGTLRVAGLEVPRFGRQVRAQAGLVPQMDNLDVELTVRQNLRAHARFYPLAPAERERRIADLLARFGLEAWADRRIRTLSGGMRRRLLIARALLPRPRLLVLDEPSAGLDPSARREVWELLVGLKEEGVTLLLSTHDMEEARLLCDRLLLLDRGRAVAEGRPEDLIARYVGAVAVEVHLLGDRPPDGVVEAGRALGAERVQVLGRTVYLYFRRRQVSDLDRLAGPGRRLLLRDAGLEDVFLLLTGRRLEGA